MRTLSSLLRSFRGRLALVVGFIAPAVFWFGVRRQSAHHEMIRAQLVEELGPQTHRAATRLELWLQDRQSDLQVIANFAPAWTDADIEAFLRLKSEWKSVCLVDPSGSVIAHAPADATCAGLAPGRIVLTARQQNGRRWVASVLNVSFLSQVDLATVLGMPASSELLDRAPAPAAAQNAESSDASAAEQIGRRPMWLRISVHYPMPRGSGSMWSPTRIAWTVLALAILLCAALLMALEWVSGPLGEMALAAEKFAGGVFSHRVPELGPSAVRSLARSINRMGEHLAKLYQQTREEAVRQTHELLQSLVTSLEEVAQQKSAEVDAQNALLQQQNQELERASRLKSEFLASMSHELRTPLTSVLGYAELMLEDLAGPLTEEQREYLGDIHRSGKHLLAMINDILDLAKIEAGRMILARDRVDLSEVLAKAAELTRPIGMRKGVELVIHSAPVICVGDSQRLTQVAVNLISNALKFTPNGGSVTVAVRDVPDAAELTVVDTGIGIDPAHHQLIFDAFQQVDGSATREHQGTGLGLALVRKFVEGMGGAISLQSALGAGATFRVLLPVRAEQRVDSSQRAA